MSANNGPKQDAEQFVVLVRLRARADKIEEAKRALEKIADPTRANPDCHEFRIFQDKGDPQSFVLLERWVSLAAVMAHAERDYMADYMAKKDEIFETQPRGDFVWELKPEGSAS